MGSFLSFYEKTFIVLLPIKIDSVIITASANDNAIFNVRLLNINIFTFTTFFIGALKAYTYNTTLFFKKISNFCSLLSKFIFF